MEEKHVFQDAVSCAASETFGTFLVPIFDFFKSLFSLQNLFKFICSVLVLVILTLIFKLARKSIRSISEEKLAGHHAFLLQKMVKYIFWVIVLMYVLSQFGVKLSAIWGAAGIAGVAIGFAAQTSMSNLISGLFVLSEKAMKVGDFVVAGGVSGTVDSIGLLSIRIHTPDNQMVRIPNSTVINSNFQNNNYFATRRFTFTLSVPYSADMESVLAAVKTVPALCPTVLSDPAPSAWYDGFAESGIILVLAVWFKPKDLIQVKNEVYIAIKKVLDERNISIPFNRVDVEILK